MSAEYKGKAWGNLTEALESLVEGKEETKTPPVPPKEEITTVDQGTEAEISFHSNDEVYALLKIYVTNLGNRLSDLWSDLQALESGIGVLSQRKQATRLDKILCKLAAKELKIMMSLTTTLADTYNNIALEINSKEHPLTKISMQTAREICRQVLKRNGQY